MITVRMIEYWNDYRKKERKERFMSLEHLADWIFDQMKVNYSDKRWTYSLYFPKCETRDRISYISVTPEYGGSCLWIKLIEEDGLGIIFSDGTFTARQNFAPDEPEQETDDAMTERAISADAVKMVAYKIHKAGGCDAKDEYSKGYDEAISLALDILLKETGLDFDEVMDYVENHAEGRTA